VVVAPSLDLETGSGGLDATQITSTDLPQALVADGDGTCRGRSDATMSGCLILMVRCGATSSNATANQEAGTDSLSTTIRRQPWITRRQWSP
jgi:hypothetical protein